jgi:hypothetical protein
MSVIPVRADKAEKELREGLTAVSVVLQDIRNARMSQCLIAT